MQYHWITHRALVAVSLLGIGLIHSTHGKSWSQNQIAPINDFTFEEAAEREVARLHDAGQLISLPAFFKSLPAKRPEIPVPTPNDSPMEPPDLAARLEASSLAIGTTSYCKDCDAWHVYLSSGFIVADGGIAVTSLHVFQDIDEGADATYPVAIDIRGRVYPVTKLLTADDGADTCLIQLVGADDLPPLPLATGARTGESVYLMSHPDTRYFRFSEGIIARLVGLDTDRGDVTFLDVTAEFAPGSSGGPLVNRYGNVVGHVSSIAATPLAEDGSVDDGSAVVERLCTTAEVLSNLVKPGINRKISAQSTLE